MKGLVALIAVVTLAVAGCSTSSVRSPSDSPRSASAVSGAGLVNVVASTNVYGDIVKTIGGPAVAVTSIIDSPDRDPHEYEADARTQLALSKAQLVIENGGGLRRLHGHHGQIRSSQADCDQCGRRVRAEPASCRRRVQRTPLV
jgi:ABC-type Zn uptake system ZnuABC Zn-binding protein ZnuA